MSYFAVPKDLIKLNSFLKNKKLIYYNIKGNNNNTMTWKNKVTTTTNHVIDFMKTIEFVFMTSLTILGISCVYVYLVKIKSPWLKNTEVLTLQKIQGITLILFSLYAWIFEYVDSYETTILTFPLILFFYCIFSPEAVREDKKKLSANLICTFFILFSLLISIYSKNLFVFFIALEITGFSFLILLGSKKTAAGAEAAIKMFFVSAISSGFLLLGIAELYLSFGTLNLELIAKKMGTLEYDLFFSLLFLALSIKLAVFPFHAWYSDIYQAAGFSLIPLFNVASLLYFFVMCKIGKSQMSLNNCKSSDIHFVDGASIFSTICTAFLIGVIIISILILMQGGQILRFMAYSSSVNFIILTFVIISSSFDTQSMANCFLQLILYILNTIYVARIANKIFKDKNININKKEDMTIESFRGLGKMWPLLAIALLYIFLSLANLPPTGGFVTITFVLLESYQQHLSAYNSMLIICILLIGKTISTVFYIRIISTMFRESKKATKIKEGTLQRWLDWTTFDVMIGYFTISLNIWVLLEPAGFIEIIAEFIDKVM